MASISRGKRSFSLLYPPPPPGYKFSTKNLALPAFGE